jgi:glyoxylase-like metal-dependent hydrolase (beta-lactamase superfamily II)
MSRAAPEDRPDDQTFGPVQVLFGEGGGRYPDGNSIVVRGERESVLMDPAIGLVARGEARPSVDRVVLSHCHEDHIAGAHLYADVPIHVHTADRHGLTSLDAMLDVYSFGGAIEQAFRAALVQQFNYAPRPDAEPFLDGHIFDLGGVTLRAIHTPGHTRGHCCLQVDWQEAGAPRRLVYLGDIELTSFGPYYGDAWSDLEDFERSLALVREIEADWYATFHHIGVLEGRESFLERLDKFEGAIARRERALLEFLAEPHDLDEVVEHRFVYRPKDPIAFAAPVERRSMSMHIDRLLERGTLRRIDGNRYVVA